MPTSPILPTPRPALEMLPVTSSCASHLGYDRSTLQLVVQLASGAAYRYEGVPAAVADAFMGSDSIGRFYQTRIRGHFQMTKIGQAAPRPPRVWKSAPVPDAAPKVRRRRAAPSSNALPPADTPAPIQTPILVPHGSADPFVDDAVSVLDVLPEAAPRGRPGPAVSLPVPMLAAPVHEPAPAAVVVEATASTSSAPAVPDLTSAEPVVMTPAEGRVIAGRGYDHGACALYLTFRHARTHCYTGVAPAVWQALQASPDGDAGFQSLIVGRYPCKQVPLLAVAKV
jgi:hypothetical protein